MIRRLERQLLVLHFLADIVLTLLALRFAELLRQHLLLGIEQRKSTGPIVLDIQVYIIAAVVWSVVFQVLPIFDSKRTTTLLQEFGGLFKAVAVCVLAMASLFYFFDVPPSRLFFLYFWLFDLGLLMSFHALVRQLQRQARARGHDTRNVVVVGTGSVGQAVIAAIQDHAWSGLRLVGVVDDERLHGVRGVPRLGSIDALPALLDAGDIDEVILALPSSAHETVVHLSQELQRFPIMVRVAPDVLDVFLLHSTVTDLWGLPLLTIREPAITGMRWLLKRMLDLAVAATLLILLAPAMALIALAILLESGRPVVLRQSRVGEHGTVFRMYKFRTMYPQSPNDPEPARKEPLHPRITPLGRYLRRTSLDELPQLVNVLRGEMSLVGPRPELPSIVAGYEPWQHARHVVPPGMTGWWQINGRSELPLHLNTQMDLFYIQNFSVLLDLRILARTLGAVIRGRGAY
ncbi:MAG TPA: sugar transferase [Chloroflexota bacterium]|nr:sugar transferase [Chloroflexota bacterium]